MNNKFINLSMITSAFLALITIPVMAEDNLLKNGSFEDYNINKDNGRWKLVEFSNWTGAGEVWNNKIGKAATEGEYKIELDVGSEVNELSQIVTTVEGTQYKLSLDAYARRTNSSDFQVLVDGEVVATVKPDRKWAEYAVYFVGTGVEQIISLKELDAQSNGLGSIIDNVKLEVSQEMIVNGSFEDFSIEADHGRWKEVRFNAWEGKGEAWNNYLGKRSTKGAYKIELDVGQEVNSLSQIVTTVNRVEYELSLDAYARRANSSDFEIWIDEEKLETFKPLKEWINYGFKFFGNGTSQTISIREVESQNNGLGTIIDNVSLVPTGSFDNRPPLIEGVAKKTVAAYNFFVFTPTASDVDGDTLTFSIENKPAWAEFNSTTGTLSGTPSIVGISADIKITVSDGKLSTALAPFSVEVTEAVDIAQKYGKATQPAKDGYYYYGSPDKMIDGDDSTYNHTEGTTTKNWVQIEVPSPTKISSIMIKGRDSSAYRLGGATVYISDTPYNGTLDASQKVFTLEGNNQKQYIEFTEAQSGTYVIIKGKDSLHIHISTVEIYGEMPNAPKFIGTNYVTTTNKWMNKSESIFNVQASDYQEDNIVYSIEEDVPFDIDANGDIRVTDVLNNESYTFEVVASDGIYSTRQSMTVNVSSETSVNQVFRSNDNTPALSGYVPNTYNKGDTLTVTIAGVSYEAFVSEEGRWSIADDSIENPLAVGTYDVSLSVNAGEAIVYEEYFEIYSSMLQSSMHSLSLETIADVSVQVSSYTQTPLVKDERVRGSSVWLRVENGVLTLENKSYREIKSLLGKYKDKAGKDVLVKLDFNQNILPYSTNVLEHFENADVMEIVHTAGHFDTELSFGGTDCDVHTDTNKTIYCTPTSGNDEIYSDNSGQNFNALSEHQVYSVAMATYSHLYNSVDGLNAMKAWVEGTTYKTLDYTGSYQSSESYLEFEDDKLAYLNENYFRVTMPNNHVKYSSMRYKYAAEGMGGGRSGNLLGTSSGGHFASAWEGSLNIDKKGTNIYDTIHHEAMHGIGFSHASGMTYGWSHAIKQVVDKIYTVGENPVVEVPKYVFETKVLGKAKIQLTIHKTSEATEDEVIIELLSGTAVMDNQYSVEQSDNDENNQVTIAMDNELFTRFFLRVYASDSDELMSTMITPSDMETTYLASDENSSKAYHAITHENWERGAKALNTTLKTNEAQEVCKLWIGSDASIAYQVDAELLNNKYKIAITNADWLESKNLLGRRAVWYQYLAYDYSNNGYSTTWKDYNKLVNDDTLGILCVTPK